MTDEVWQPPQSTEPTPPRSNAWKWAIGIGCGCPLLVLIGLGVLAGGVWLGMDRMMESEPVRRAETEAEANPDVAAALGLPIAASLTFEGGARWNESTAGKSMIATLLLEGPSGSAPVTVHARQVDGEWVVSVMQVELDGVTIDLLTDGYEVAE